jgi:hypothetical protein
MYTDFLAATIEAHGHIEEDRIAEAFDRLDSDDNGYSTFFVWFVVVYCAHENAVSLAKRPHSGAGEAIHKRRS